VQEKIYIEPEGNEHIFIVFRLKRIFKINYYDLYLQTDNKT
jgi:hypothetical protein